MYFLEDTLKSIYEQILITNKSPHNTVGNKGRIALLALALTIVSVNY